MKNDDISVFIVEDYLLLRLSLKGSLVQLGISVMDVFESAETCISALENTRPDVVLMDLGLPKMNGIEATRAIKSKYPDIKVIVLTSHESEDEVLASMASGASAYCLKETATETLVNIIKMVNGGALCLDPKIAKAAYKYFPIPKTTDIDNLYDDPSFSVKLTERESAVLRLLAEGKSNTEIAKEILISPHTAKAHVGKILEKFAVSDRVQLAVKAVKYKLI